MKWHCNPISYVAEFRKYEVVESHTSDDSDLNKKLNTRQRTIDYRFFFKRYKNEEEPLDDKTINLVTICSKSNTSTN